MGAMDGRESRLDETKEQARQLIDAAPAGTGFSIIGYALDSRTLAGTTARKDELFEALAKLHPLAVAARAAALRAALIDARGASSIEIFADRAPFPEVIRETRPEGRVEVHQFGSPAANIAIASLDPGVPKSSPGHCVLRNFSNRPMECELAIDNGSKQIVRSPLILEPRAQAIVTFAPLDDGGLIHARILTPDALAADNDRYALAPSTLKAQALVLSPDADVRDDLARIVLAIDANMTVTAMDPAQFKSSKASAQQFTLAILHDCSDAEVQAFARLFIFPEPWLKHSRRPPVIPVVRSVALLELQSREDTGALPTPALIGPSRVVAIPGWMDTLARGAAAGERESFPVAAAGRNANGEIGVIAFDIRNHMLLDPDRLDALVLTVDTLKRLIAPQDIKVVPTGPFVAISTLAPATLRDPDGAISVLQPDRWGRVRFRPLEAGRYTVSANHRRVEVFANYYDAAESDLSAPAASSHSAITPVSAGLGSGEVYLKPLALPLIAGALIFFLCESA
jgi:hypothetical protein